MHTDHPEPAAFPHSPERHAPAESEAEIQELAEYLDQLNCELKYEVWEQAHQRSQPVPGWKTAVLNFIDLSPTLLAPAVGTLANQSRNLDTRVLTVDSAELRLTRGSDGLAIQSLSPIPAACRLAIAVLQGEAEVGRAVLGPDAANAALQLPSAILSDLRFTVSLEADADSG